MRVIRRIAQGGFGVVEEVKKGSTHLARKTFKPNPVIAGDKDLREKALRRFVRETTIQSRIDHPHIVPILEMDLTTDPPWFIMPLAQESFEKQVVRDQRARSVDIDALVQILAGLEELHRLGYVHRDLKPQNILRIADHWMLSDFGLILPMADQTTTLTSTNSAWGTPAYAAPELVIDFHSAPAQADIYAVGCILHDIIENAPRIPFGKLTVAGPLGPVVERCTELRPEDRFPNVAALRSAVVMAFSSPPAVGVAQEVKDWVAKLTSDPPNLDPNEWSGIIRYVEKYSDSDEAALLLNAIDIPQIKVLIAISPALFARLVVSVTRWAREETFGFAYCDVVGARLMAIYELGGVRERAEATMAALKLGCSHNRWFVMRLFVRMAGPDIDRDLADRLVVEFFTLDAALLPRIEQIEFGIRVTREALHPRLCEAIKQIAKQGR